MTGGRKLVLENADTYKRILSELENDDYTMAALARKMNLKTSTVTIMVESLCNMHFPIYEYNMPGEKKTFYGIEYHIDSSYIQSDYDVSDFYTLTMDELTKLYGVTSVTIRKVARKKGITDKCRFTDFKRKHNMDNGADRAWREPTEKN